MLRVIVIACGIAVGLAATSIGYAQDVVPIDRFVGSYTGSTVVGPNGERQDRDTNVTIEETDKGFAVEWVTLIPRGNQDVERRESRIEFRRTRRPNIYIAAQRKDRFGGVQPLDPVRGDPYFWASLDEKIITVYGVHVTDDGGYELQIYERRLTTGGMQLRFRRIRNGETIRDIQGILTRKS